MAKTNSQDENETVTYQGKTVNPDIQKKVESYMELSDEELVAAENHVQEASPEKDSEISSAVEAEKDTSTAPLLPTDKLPGGLVEEPKNTKINVTEAEAEPTTPETEVPDSEMTEEQEAVPESEDADEESKDSSQEDVPDTEVEDENQSNIDEIADEQLPPPEKEESVEPPVDEEKANIYENEPEKLVGPAGALWAKYQDKTLAEVADVPLENEVEDPETEQVIKEIIAEDSDTILGIEDKKRTEAKPIVEPKKKRSSMSVGEFFKAWFKNPLYRKLTIVALLAIVAVFAAVPATRYFVLNSIGVRASTSVRVLDSKTTLPLKNVELVIDGKSAKTDIDGNAKVDGVRLGTNELLIKKPAFAELSQTVTLGWGSNPLGDFEIQPVGAQYRFFLTDFLSKEPITDGELVYEESNARFSREGEAIITVPTVSEEEIVIQIISKDYRTENFKVSTTKKQDQYAVAMVPSKKHVFFSKRSGKVDLYKTDVDGKNQKVILAGSGIEKDESLGIAPHPTKDIVAFSSSRENVRNGDGFLLNTLQIINLSTNEITKLTQSERIQIIDWVDDRLIYVKIAEGASQASTDRHRLISYNLETGKEDELASTNYFNDILSVNGSIYYSPALYKVNGTVGLYKISADGSNKKTIFNKEVWNIFRTEYEKASISVGKDWYELNLNDDTIVKVGGAPTVLKSRLYVDSPDGKQSLWIDERDGKTVLISYDKQTKKDRVLITESGIQTPIRWLDNAHIVYRVENSQETADYVLSLMGGASEKIADVTSSYGIDRWYYY